MNRTLRAVLLSTTGLVLLAACRKKVEPAPTPTPPASTPTETCDAACQRAKADSIAAEEARRRAAEEARLREEEMKRTAAARAALAAAIYFDYDQATISDASRATLDAKLPILRANPQMRLLISGHADERGGDEYNFALGQRRAAAAKRYLVDQGVDESRIDITSFGEERPAVEGTSEESFAQNRRAEFEIVAGGDRITVPR